MRELNRYIDECIDEIESYGIEVRELLSDYTFKIDMRCSSRMGRCSYTKREIGISDFMLDENVLKDDHWLRDTIIHEMLHAATPRSGHKGKWKQLANQVNYRSGGKYNIRRCGDFNEMGIKQNAKKIKYIVECPKCGYQWKFTRMCKTVRYPNHYTHTKCGETLRLLTVS